MPLLILILLPYKTIMMRHRLKNVNGLDCIKKKLKNFNRGRRHVKGKKSYLDEVFTLINNYMGLEGLTRERKKNFFV